MTNLTQVAVVGAGNMGGGMLRRLRGQAQAFGGSTPRGDRARLIADWNADRIPVLLAAFAAALKARTHRAVVERDILERALERHRYNRTAAGASLGLSLRQMRYRMARLAIAAPSSGTDPDELS